MQIGKNASQYAYRHVHSGSTSPGEPHWERQQGQGSSWWFEWDSAIQIQLRTARQKHWESLTFDSTWIESDGIDRQAIKQFLYQQHNTLTSNRIHTEEAFENRWRRRRREGDSEENRSFYATILSLSIPFNCDFSFNNTISFVIVHFRHHILF